MGDEDDDDDDRSICVQMAGCGQEGAIFPDLSGECGGENGLVKVMVTETFPQTATRLPGEFVQCSHKLND